MTVVDEFTTESLMIAVERSMTGTKVVQELSKLIRDRGRPEEILSDNGTELTCSAIIRWTHEEKIQWRYIQLGKPMQNSYKDGEMIIMSKGRIVLLGGLAPNAYARQLKENPNLIVV